MNLPGTNVPDEEGFDPPDGSPSPEQPEHRISHQPDGLDEKVKAVLEKAKQGEAAAVEKLRREEEARLDQAL